MEKFKYKNITDKFLSLEKKHDLLSYKISNVYFWQISRIRIYFAIKKKLDSKRDNQFNSDVKSYKKKILYRVFINSLFFNPFFSKKYNIIVFDSGRLYKFQESYIDIYTHYLCNYFEKERKKYIKYETNYENDKTLTNRTLKNKHIDFINIASKFITVFQNFKLSNEDKNFLHLIEKEINASFNINLNLYEIIISDIKDFKSKYLIYNMLFRKISPKEIFLINGGLKTYIVAAAKNNNIRVNELQHGLISNYGIVNNFPYSPPDSIAYYPNRFFKWSNIYMCHAILPLSKRNIVNFTNEHLNKMLESTKDINKEKNTILIISQPNVSLDIIKFVERNLHELRDYEILYKAHPAENKDILQDFIMKVSKMYSNIYFIDNEYSIYSLMKKSQYVIGVYSSALFEAPVFGCNVILLNFEGVEMAYPLLEDKRNIIIEVNSKLSDFIN